MRMRSLLAALLLGAAAPAQAQEIGLVPSLAGGLHVQSFRFQEGMGASSATLYLLPVAYQLPLSRRALLEFYASHGTGSVEMDGRTYRLSAFTDSWMRASYTVGPKLVASVGLNLPTGHPTHDAQEAVVATVLSTDLLGFREASWGMGFAATGGLSTMRQLGPWSVSLGASYRRSGQFEPRADTGVVYAPGDEVRARAAMERTFASGSSLSIGVMAMEYTHDQLDGYNLFAAGPRVMLDASYAFAALGTTWSVYGADIWRGQGQVTLPIISQGATVRTDSAYSVGQQNMVVAGIGGKVKLSSRLVLRPGADVRYQRGNEVGADGWVTSLGADLPLRIGPMEVFPSGRVLIGSLENRSRVQRRAGGMEFSLVTRMAR